MMVRGVLSEFKKHFPALLTFLIESCESCLCFPISQDICSGTPGDQRYLITTCLKVLHAKCQCSSELIYHSCYIDLF